MLYVGNQKLKPIVDNKDSLLTSKQIPYDAEIEFLTSNGGQYINTGIVLGYNMGLGFNIRVNEGASGTWKLIYGYRISSPRIQYQINYNTSSKAFVCDYSQTAGLGTAVSVMQNTWHKVDIKPNPTTQKLIWTVDDANMVEVSFVNQQALKAYLFCSNVNGIPEYRQQNLSISASWIYDANGNIIQYLIPVRVGQRGYMYDKISGKLFENKGTGSFILGPDKEDQL